MVYNVFQPSFKLKGNKRGKLFSIIWGIEWSYSSALNTWSRLESHSGCLSDSAIIKLDNSQQMSYYVRRIFYTIYS